MLTRYNLTILPSVYILHSCHSATSHNDPFHLLVPIVHFLVLHICGYQRPISGFQVYPFLPIRKSNGSMTSNSINDGVLGSMMMYARGGMGFG